MSVPPPIQSIVSVQNAPALLEGAVFYVTPKNVPQNGFILDPTQSLDGSAQFPFARLSDALAAAEEAVGEEFVSKVTIFLDYGVHEVREIDLTDYDHLNSPSVSLTIRSLNFATGASSLVAFSDPNRSELLSVETRDQLLASYADREAIVAFTSSCSRVRVHATNFTLAGVVLAAHPFQEKTLVEIVQFDPNGPSGCGAADVADYLYAREVVIDSTLLYLCADAPVHEERQYTDVYERFGDSWVSYRATAIVVHGNTTSKAARVLVSDSAVLCGTEAVPINTSVASYGSVFFSVTAANDRDGVLPADFGANDDIFSGDQSSRTTSVRVSGTYFIGGVIGIALRNVCRISLRRVWCSNMLVGMELDRTASVDVSTCTFTDVACGIVHYGANQQNSVVYNRALAILDGRQIINSACALERIVDAIVERCPTFRTGTAFVLQSNALTFTNNEAVDAQFYGVSASAPANFPGMPFAEACYRAISQGGSFLNYLTEGNNGLALGQSVSAKCSNAKPSRSQYITYASMAADASGMSQEERAQAVSCFFTDAIHAVPTVTSQIINSGGCNGLQTQYLVTGGAWSIVVRALRLQELEVGDSFFVVYSGDPRPTAAGPDPRLPYLDTCNGTMLDMSQLDRWAGLCIQRQSEGVIFSLGHMSNGKWYSPGNGSTVVTQVSQGPLTLALTRKQEAVGAPARLQLRVYNNTESSDITGDFSTYAHLSSDNTYATPGVEIDAHDFGLVGTEVVYTGVSQYYAASQPLIGFIARGHCASSPRLFTPAEIPATNYTQCFFWTSIGGLIDADAPCGTTLAGSAYQFSDFEAPGPVASAVAGPLAALPAGNIFRPLAPDPANPASSIQISALIANYGSGNGSESDHWIPAADYGLSGGRLIPATESFGLRLPAYFSHDTKSAYVMQFAALRDNVFSATTQQTVFTPFRIRSSYLRGIDLGTVQTKNLLANVGIFENVVCFETNDRFVTSVDFEQVAPSAVIATREPVHVVNYRVPTNDADYFVSIDYTPDPAMAQLHASVQALSPSEASAVQGAINARLGLGRVTKLSDAAVQLQMQNRVRVVPLLFIFDEVLDDNSDGTMRNVDVRVNLPALPASSSGTLGGVQRGKWVPFALNGTIARSSGAPGSSRWTVDVSPVPNGLDTRVTINGVPQPFVLFFVEAASAPWRTPVHTSVLTTRVLQFDTMVMFEDPATHTITTMSVEEYIAQQFGAVSSSSGAASLNFSSAMFEDQLEGDFYPA